MYNKSGGYMKKLFIILSLFLLTGCSLYDEYKMPKKVFIDTNSSTFEVYDKHILNELIDDKNVEILNNKENLDTSKIGENKVTIKYKYKKREYKYDVTYNVIDTKSPITLHAPKEYNYSVGEDIDDFCKHTSFIDNYDRKAKCKILNEYDVNTPGTYNLEYVFYDSSNNETKEPFTLTINDPDEIDEYYDEIIEDDEDDEETGILFSDVIKKYKTKDTMIGIDISRWQGDIDFNKIKEEGCEFVIIRMAVSNGPTDEIGLDSYFKQNIKKAKEAGLKVGVYVYTAASKKSEIIKQAKFVKKELKNEKLDFPIAYDFESWSDIRELKLNTFDLIDYINEFYNIVKEDGYEVMLYSSKNYLEKVWLNKSYPVWLAHYTDETNYTGDYIMWQMCSDGLINGIEGNVDIDIYYKK